MHELVISDNQQKKVSVKTLDIAKRLLDYQYHPPTIYFPLNVEEALMIEPTETETKETLDGFIETMLEIAREREMNQNWFKRRLIQPLSNGWMKQWRPASLF